MKSLLSMAVIVLAASSAWADCQINSLKQVTVFTSTSQDLVYSDFEGLTVAGTDIKAEDFRFGPGNSKASCGLSLSLAGGLQVKRGAADFGVELNGPTARLVKLKEKYPTFSYPSLRRTQIVQIENLKNQMHDLSATLVEQAEGEKLASIQHDVVHMHTIITTQSSAQVAYADVDANLLAMTRFLEIKGQLGQSLVLNIRGHVGSLQSLQINVENIKPNQIVWNFHQAGELILSRIGGLNNLVNARPGDNSLGVQGVVLAPWAQVRFSESKITGALWAKQIVRDQDLATGQVNQLPGLEIPTDDVVPVLPPTPVKPD